MLADEGVWRWLWSSGIDAEKPEGILDRGKVEAWTVAGSSEGIGSRMKARREMAARGWLEEDPESEGIWSGGGGGNGRMGQGA